MKILLCITGLGMGGAEKVVIGLAEAFADRGHEVNIAYLTGVALVVPRNHDIAIVSLGMKSGRDFFSAYFRLRRLVMDFQPDVVHSHMVHANILARLLRLTTTIPLLICTAHSSNEGGALRMLAYRLTDMLADLSTNVSDEAVAAFVARRAVKPGRMITVYNGISTSVFAFSESARAQIRKQLDVEDGCHVILAVGRLTAAKDYPNFLRALRTLRSSSVYFKAFIVGDGPLKRALKAEVDELNITEHLEFLGVRNDVPELMSAADVFVLSSAWEGFGLVVAEAMACECLVVATDCGGVKEVVGDCGYLVSPSNSTALYDAIVQGLTLTSSEADSLRARGRERIVRNYSLEVAVDRWIDLYSSH